MFYMKIRCITHIQTKNTHKHKRFLNHLRIVCLTKIKILWRLHKLIDLLSLLIKFSNLSWTSWTWERRVWGLRKTASSEKWLRAIMRTRSERTNRAMSRRKCTWLFSNLLSSRGCSSGRKCCERWKENSARLRKQSVLYFNWFERFCFTILHDFIL